MVKNASNNVETIINNFLRIFIVELVYLLIFVHLIKINSRIDSVVGQLATKN